MSFVRLSPEVQRVQLRAAYIDIYTNALVDPLRRLPTHVKTTHGHPEPERWTRGGGYGARHIHDKAPFSLWDDTSRAFLKPSKKQFEWIKENFEVEAMGMQETYLWIATANPPTPVPLTLGCQPVLFVGVGESPEVIIPITFYPNPRMPDPCPDISWPKLSNPTKQQSLTVLAALDDLGLVNMQGIIYMPYYIVVELVYGDGREYGNQSLPGKIAGRNAVYHHSPVRFFDTMEDLNRQRRLDPAAYNEEEVGPMPEDGDNYLRRGEQLTPGTYFQAETPMRLMEADEIIQGSWSEADGMSLGLISLQAVGWASLAPTRPPGYPEISFSKWLPFNINQIFGAINSRIVDGVCGAPIVSVDGGGLQGFFHISNGTYTLCPHLDDLFAEGWVLV